MPYNTNTTIVTIHISNTHSSTEYNDSTGMPIINLDTLQIITNGKNQIITSTIFKKILLISSNNLINEGTLSLSAAKTMPNNIPKNSTDKTEPSRKGEKMLLGTIATITSISFLSALTCSNPFVGRVFIASAKAGSPICENMDTDNEAIVTQTKETI